MTAQRVLVQIIGVFIPSPFHFILLFPVPVPIPHAMLSGLLCHQLDNTAGLCDLTLSIFANVSSAHDEGDLGAASLSEKLGVPEGQQVDDWGCVFRLAGDVLLAQVLGK